MLVFMYLNENKLALKNVFQTGTMNKGKKKEKN